MAWTEVAKGYWPGESGGGGYKMTPHSPSKSKTLPWQWCRRCGLLYLRNPATNWCIEKGCNYDDHPQYSQMIKRLTAQKKEG